MEELKEIYQQVCLQKNFKYMKNLIPKLKQISGRTDINENNFCEILAFYINKFPKQQIKLEIDDPSDIIEFLTLAKQSWDEGKSMREILQLLASYIWQKYEVWDLVFFTTISTLILSLSSYFIFGAALFSTFYTVSLVSLATISYQNKEGNMIKEIIYNYDKEVKDAVLNFFHISVEKNHKQLLFETFLKNKIFPNYLIFLNGKIPEVNDEIIKQASELSKNKNYYYLLNSEDPLEGELKRIPIEKIITSYSFFQNKEFINLIKNNFYNYQKYENIVFNVAKSSGGYYYLINGVEEFIILLTLSTKSSYHCLVSGKEHPLDKI